MEDQVLVFAHCMYYVSLASSGGPHPASCTAGLLTVHCLLAGCGMRKRVKLPFSASIGVVNLKIPAFNAESIGQDIRISLMLC